MSIMNIKNKTKKFIEMDTELYNITSLDSLIKRYGEDEGLIRYNDFTQNKPQEIEVTYNWLKEKNIRYIYSDKLLSKFKQSYAIITNINKTIFNNNIWWLSTKKLTEYRRYSNKVWEITKLQDIGILKDAELRAAKGYHLDHKISIYQGFKKGINYKIIGSLYNLQMLHYAENCTKKTNCYSVIEQNNHLKGN